MEKPGILIIDDDRYLKKTLSDILTANGYRTFTAMNGTEGLALLERHCVKLALVDLALPDISGIEVLEKIKAHTGKGISAENMKKLFQPLFTTKTRGIDLGLALCKNFTEANGGRGKERPSVYFYR